jgi:hypothetical protein
MDMVVTSSVLAMHEEALRASLGILLASRRAPVPQPGAEQDAAICRPIRTVFVAATPASSRCQ